MPTSERVIAASSHTVVESSSRTVSSFKILLVAIMKRWHSICERRQRCGLTREGAHCTSFISEANLMH